MTTLFVLTAASVHAEPNHASLQVEQYQRSYVYTTPAETLGPAALVLILPDAGVDGATALDRYRWASLAGKEGFVAVGLDPLQVDPDKPEMFQTNPGFWSDGSGRGNARRGNLDDVAFVRAVIDDLSRKIRIDPKRIYATGFGNGGSMVHRLGLELSDRIAAIAPVAGHLWKAGIPDRPLSVLMVYGSRDPVDPVLGGPGMNIWSHAFDQRPATTVSATGWVHALDCKTGPTANPQPGGVTQTMWRQCNGAASVDYLVVPGQGHHWPGGRDDDQPSLGPACDTLDGTVFIWDWFKTHPRS